MALIPLQMPIVLYFSFSRLEVLARRMVISYRVQLIATVITPFQTKFNGAVAEHFHSNDSYLHAKLLSFIFYKWSLRWAGLCKLDLCCHSWTVSWVRQPPWRFKEMYQTNNNCTSVFELRSSTLKRSDVTGLKMF